MNKGGRSTYYAKCNVAEIGAVNMDDIGAVKKRSRSGTGPHDRSPCVVSIAEPSVLNGFKAFKCSYVASS